MKTILMESRFGYVTFISCSKLTISWGFKSQTILNPLTFVNYKRMTLPAILLNPKTVDFSPCSDDTCWKVCICLKPINLISWRRFCTPVLLPDHIYSGDVILAVSLTCFRSLYQLDITLGFTPISLAIDRFFKVMSGCHFKKPASHLWLVVWVSLPKPWIWFTLAYWNGSWHTLPIVNRNHESWNCFIVEASIASSSVKYCRIFNLRIYASSR